MSEVQARHITDGDADHHDHDNVRKVIAQAAAELAFLELSRMGRPQVVERWVALDDSDPENYYSVTVFDTLENLQAWESSAEYTNEYLPAVSSYLVGGLSSSICTVEVGRSFPR